MKPTIRSSDAAFEDAIEGDVLSEDPLRENYAGNYMYMYTQDGVDFFKHYVTRTYIKSVI